MKKIITILCLLFATSTFAAEPVHLLNASYDTTREFYDAYNKLFADYWKSKAGEDVKITQSHGGSGKQARSVIDGLRADVVTLGLAYDIDAIAEHGLIKKDWQSQFPNNSSPYNSAIVFLVKKGNPKNIKDWDDLVKPDIKILTPNPKTSGVARWNYLAAWGYALKKNNNSEDAAKEFIGKIFKNTQILDSGGRGATTNFIKRNIGDVLVTWENEALFVSRDMNKGEFEVVVPSVSILAEPPVAVIDKNTEKNGTAEVAKEYLEYLYSEPAQELIAKFYFRPSDARIAAKYADNFPKTTLLNIKDFGGWQEVQKKHFADGGIFDQIYAK